MAAATSAREVSPPVRLRASSWTVGRTSSETAGKVRRCLTGAALAGQKVATRVKRTFVENRIDGLWKTERYALVFIQNLAEK